MPCRTGRRRDHVTSEERAGSGALRPGLGDPGPIWPTALRLDPALHRLRNKWALGPWGTAGRGLARPDKACLAVRPEAVCPRSAARRVTCGKSSSRLGRGCRAAASGTAWSDCISSSMSKPPGTVTTVAAFASVTACRSSNSSQQQRLHQQHTRALRALRTAASLHQQHSSA